MADLFLADLGREETRLARHQMPGLTSLRRVSGDVISLDYSRESNTYRLTSQNAVLIATVSSRTKVQSAPCNAFSTRNQFDAATLVSLNGAEAEPEGVPHPRVWGHVTSPVSVAAAECGPTWLGELIGGRAMRQKRNQ